MSDAVSLTDWVKTIEELSQTPHFLASDYYPGQDFVVGLCAEAITQYTHLYVQQPALKEICRFGIQVMKQLQKERQDRLNPHSFEVDVRQALW